MKSQLFRVLLPILCAGFLMLSCSDEDERIDWNPNYHAKDFLEDTKSSLKQEIKLNTSQLPYTITLKEGVKITIPANAFTKNGTPITGEFTVEAYEMLKPSSMIFSGTNTNYAGNSIFESDGFIFIDVKQNGTSVDQNLNVPLTIDVPTDKDDNTMTMLWEGNEQAGEGEDQFAWEDMQNGEPNEKENVAFARNKTFQFLLGKLGWVNCDIFWSTGGGMTTITVKIYGNFGKLASYLGYEGDTFIFFRAKGVLVLAQIYTTVDNNTVKSYDNSVPLGAEGKLVAYSVKGGKFSYAEKEVTVTADMSIDMDLKDVTKAELEQKIKALDTYK